jgi:hypothetical protein
MSSRVSAAQPVFRRMRADIRLEDISREEIRREFKKTSKFTRITGIETKRMMTMNRFKSDRNIKG